MGGFIFLAAFWLVMMWLLEKAIGKVRQYMGLDNPFISIKERMRQGKSLTAAIIESGADRFKFGWKAFIYACKKFLPFGKTPGNNGFAEYFEYEANREAEAQKKVDEHGGNLSDYL